MDYPMLNLFDVLCVPSTEATEVSLLATFLFDEAILSVSPIF